MRRALAIFLLGCSSSAPAGSSDFPPSAYQTVRGTNVTIELRTSPTQPPMRGTDAMELTVLDRGVPKDALPLAVSVYMPSHGHSSPPPEIVPAGNGKYRMDRVSLFMPGHWEMKVVAGEETIVVPIEVE